MTVVLSIIIIFSPLAVVVRQTPEDGNVSRVTLTTPIVFAANSDDGITIESPFVCVGFAHNNIGMPYLVLNLPQCIGEGMYGLFIAASYFMIATGILFDIMVNFGLNPDVMNQTFVTQAWTAIRDLVNMAFIFILIYIAIATILDISKHNAKSILVKLIITALLINFSLFTTRAIIDAGNISALFFYDAITVNNATNLSGDAQAALDMQNYVMAKGDIKGISLAIMSTINPQQVLTKYKTDNNVGVGSEKKLDVDDYSNNVWKLAFLFLASAILVGFMGVTFLQTSFLFLSRIAILWILMAFSPFMFAGSILPETKTYTSKLWKELGSKAFCITIFLFFIWLTVLFASPGSGQELFAKDPTSMNFLQFLVILTLRFGTIIILLNYGKNLTKKQCESFNGTSFNIAGKLLGGVGAVAGLALGGGMAMAGRKLLGGMAARSLNTVRADGMTTRQHLASGNAFDRLRLRALESGERGTYDIRNSRVGKGIGYVGDKVFGASGLNEKENFFDKNVSKFASFGQRKAGEGFLTDVEKEKKYFEGMQKKLGNLNDKNPAKAAAAKLAHERFEKEMAKFPDNLMENGPNSPYYQTLKRIKTGEAPGYSKAGRKGAEKMIAEIDKNVIKNRAEIGERYGDSPKNIAKVQVAESTRKALEKTRMMEEKTASLQESREDETASYEKYRTNYDMYAASNDEAFRGIFVVPINGTMSEYKSASENALVELNKKASTIASEIKRATMQQQAAATRQAQFSAIALGQTNKALKTGMENAAKSAAQEHKRALDLIEKKDGELATVNNYINEMREFGKKIDSMKHYTEKDLSNLEKPTPTSPSLTKTDDTKK
jgi:hypothetical protein